MCHAVKVPSIQYTMERYCHLSSNMWWTYLFDPCMCQYTDTTIRSNRVALYCSRSLLASFDRYIFLTHMCKDSSLYDHQVSRISTEFLLFSGFKCDWSVFDLQRNFNLCTACCTQRSLIDSFHITWPSFKTWPLVKFPAFFYVFCCRISTYKISYHLQYSFLVHQLFKYRKHAC